MATPRNPQSAGKSPATAARGEAAASKSSARKSASKAPSESAGKAAARKASTRKSPTAKPDVAKTPFDQSQPPPATGFQSPEALAKASELHAGEARMHAIQGSISTRDRHNQGKRDSR